MEIIKIADAIETPRVEERWSKYKVIDGNRVLRPQEEINEHNETIKMKNKNIYIANKNKKLEEVNLRYFKIGEKYKIKLNNIQYDDMSVDKLKAKCFDILSIELLK